MKRNSELTDFFQKVKDANIEGLNMGYINAYLSDYPYKPRYKNAKYYRNILKEIRNCNNSVTL